MAEWVEFQCLMCDWSGRIRVKTGADVSVRLAEWGRAHNLDTGNPFGLIKVKRRYPAVELEDDDFEIVVRDERQAAEVLR